MTSRYLLAIGAAVLACGVAGGASAQDAAESAMILNGVGTGQAEAQRRMGASVSRSINSATNAVRATGGAAPVRTRRRGNSAVSVGPVPATGDPLEGTDAPSYTLSNGASIRVSGTLRTDPGTRCTQGCDAE